MLINQRGEDNGARPARGGGIAVRSDLNHLKDSGADLHARMKSRMAEVTAGPVRRNSRSWYEQRDAALQRAESRASATSGLRSHSKVWRNCNASLRGLDGIGRPACGQQCIALEHERLTQRKLSGLALFAEERQQRRELSPTAVTLTAAGHCESPIRA